MEHELADATAALSAALIRGDARAAAAMYADDGKLLSPATELLRGRREIEAFWQAGLDVGLSELELLPLELQLGAGLALEVGRYTLAVASRPESGKYAVLHRREADGVWRRAVDVFNPDRCSRLRPQTT